MHDATQAADCQLSVSSGLVRRRTSLDTLLPELRASADALMDAENAVRHLRRDIASRANRVSSDRARKMDCVASRVCSHRKSGDVALKRHTTRLARGIQGPRGARIGVCVMLCDCLRRGSRFGK